MISAIVYTLLIIYSNYSLFSRSSNRRTRTNRSNLGKQDSTTSEEETHKSTYTATVKSRFERRGSSEKTLESGSKSELTSSMDESEKDSHASDSVSSTRRAKDETDRAAPRSTRTEENPFHLSKNRITTKMSDKSSSDEIKPTGSPVS